MIILLIIVPLVTGIVYWYKVPINPTKGLVVIELSISSTTIHRGENVLLNGKLSVASKTTDTYAFEVTLQFWYRQVYTATNISNWKHFADVKTVFGIGKSGVFAYQMITPQETSPMGISII